MFNQKHMDDVFSQHFGIYLFTYLFIYFCNYCLGRNKISKGHLIGQVEFDLWTVYGQPGHSFRHKWAVLQSVGKADINGYILMSISVLGEGDDLDRNVAKSNDDIKDIDLNLLLPKDTQAPRDIYKYSVSIIEAEAIPAATTSVFGSVKKALGGKHIELADTYVEVCFAELSINDVLLLMLWD